MAKKEIKIYKLSGDDHSELEEKGSIIRGGTEYVFDPDAVYVDTDLYNATNDRIKNLDDQVSEVEGKTEAISTNVEELNEKSKITNTKVQGILDDYLKSADKDQIEIDIVNNGVQVLQIVEDKGYLTDGSTTISNMKTKIEQSAAEIKSTAQAVAELDIDVKENYPTKVEMSSEISQTAAAIRTEVAQKYASKEETAEIKSTLEQQAGKIEAVVTSVQELDEKTTESISQLTIDLTGITSRVGNTEQGLSEVKQTASEISQDVKDLDGNVSNLSQTVNGLSSTVSSIDGRVSTVEQTSGEIKVEVKDLHDQLSEVDDQVSTVTQTANEIKAEVKDARGDKASLAIALDGIRTSVNDVDEKLSTEIEQTKGTIALKASKEELQKVDDKFNNYSTTSEMNSAIELKADEITTTVSENYTTKTETGDLKTELESEIQSTSTEIKAEVEKRVLSEGGSEETGFGWSLTENGFVLKAKKIDDISSEYKEVFRADQETGNVAISGDLLVGGKVLDKTAITTYKIEYTKTDSPTSEPGPGAVWSEGTPIWEKGKYIWQRSTPIYLDGQAGTAKIVCIQGAKGDTGEPGKDGTSISIKGTCYLKITSSPIVGNEYYIYVAPDSTIPIKGETLGEAYVDFTYGYLFICTSLSSEKFTCAGQFKGDKGDKGDRGEQGSQGSQGIPGTPGQNAISYWLESSALVHTGSSQIDDIVIKAIEKVGSGFAESWAEGTIKYAWGDSSTWQTAQETVTIPASVIKTHDEDLKIKLFASDNFEVDAETLVYSPLNTPVIDLDNDSAQLSEGKGNVSCTGSLFLNGKQIASGVSYSWNWDTEKASATLSPVGVNSTITVTEIKEDNVEFTLTITYKGQTYTKKFSVSNAKKGAQGPQGAPGSSATSFWLNVSSPIHTYKDQAEDITITAMYKEGTSDAQIWSGGTIKAYWGNASTPSYSTTGTLTIEKTVFADHKEDLRIKLFSGGVEIDSETITCSPNNAPVLDLDNDSASIRYKSDGSTKVTASDSVTSTASIYRNGEKVDLPDTFSWDWKLYGCKNKEGTSISSDTIEIDEITSNSGYALCTVRYWGTELRKTFFVTKQVDGPQGKIGPQGEQGIRGPQGENGQNTYFHIKYAPVQTPTTEQMKEDPDKFIGTYVDDIQEDSTDPTKYKWAKFEGDPGAQGIPGKNGENGKTSYLHMAYANSEDGKTGFSTTDSKGKQYLGQYVDFTLEDSTDPTKYKWTKTKGEQGESNYYLSLTNDFDSIPCDSTGQAKSDYDWSGQTLHKVSAYRGTEQIAFEMSNSQTSSSGYTCSYAVNNLTTNGAKPTSSSDKKLWSWSCTNISADVGNISYTLFYNETPLSTVKFEASKLYAGQDGADAVDYWIAASSTAISKNNSGAISPSSITFNFYKQVGNNAATTYSGYYEYIFNGSKTTGTGEEVEVITSSATTGITITLYDNDSSSKSKYDSETVPLIEDGKDGEDGDSIRVVKWYHVGETSTPPTAPPNDLTDPDDPSAVPGDRRWTLAPIGTDVQFPYEFVVERKAVNNVFREEDKWSNVVCFAHYGSDATVNSINVFNALTEDGERYGCFTYDTDRLHLYINADMIKSGFITADYINGDRLTGSEVELSGSITADSGEIGGWTIDNADGLSFEENDITLSLVPKRLGGFNLGINSVNNSAAVDFNISPILTSNKRAVKLGCIGNQTTGTGTFTSAYISWENGAQSSSKNDLYSATLVGEWETDASSSFSIKGNAFLSGKLAGGTLEPNLLYLPTCNGAPTEDPKFSNLGKVYVGYEDAGSGTKVARIYFCGKSGTNGYAWYKLSGAQV